MGGQDVDAFLIPPEAVGVELRDFGHGFTLGQGGEDHLVAAGFHQFLAHMPHVGDVFDVMDRAAVGGQDAAYPVGHQVGAEVADVGVAVHGGAAGVHRHPAGGDGPDFLNGFGQGIVDTQHAVTSCRPPPEGIDTPQFSTAGAGLHLFSVFLFPGTPG